MNILVVLALLPTLTVPVVGDDVALDGALPGAGADVSARASVGDVQIAVDADDVGLFLVAALPGPGFSRPMLPAAEIDVGAGQAEQHHGPSIPVALPQPVEAAVPAGLAVLGVLAYAAMKWRLVGPWFLLPLYSRLANSEILDNEVRSRLHELVTTSPGLSLQELCKRSGAGWGTTVYHLQRLEQAGLVASRKQGHHRRFYAVGEVDRRDIEALGMLRNATPQKIAQYLLDRPGCNQKDVCEALGISPSLAHKHLKRLEAESLVTTERQWRNVHYTPAPKLGELLKQTG